MRTAANTGTYDVRVTIGCNPMALVTRNPAALGAGICRGDFKCDGQFNGLEIQVLVDAPRAGETGPF